MIDLKDIYTQEYRVQKGDSLLKLSMKFGVSKREIMVLNGLFQETLYEGQVTTSLTHTSVDVEGAFRSGGKRPTEAGIIQSRAGEVISSEPNQHVQDRTRAIIDSAIEATLLWARVTQRRI